MIRDAPLSDDEIREAVEAHRASCPPDADDPVADRARLVREAVRLARRGHAPTAATGSAWPDPATDGDGEPVHGRVPHEPAEGEIDPAGLDSPAEIEARPSADEVIGAAACHGDRITGRVLTALARDPAWPDAEATVGAVRHVVATTLEIVREELADEIARLRAAAADGSDRPTLRPTLVPPADSANE